MKKILVTGGAGFIGAHFIETLLKAQACSLLLCLDSLEYSGSMENMADFMGHPAFRFVRGDICDRARVEELLSSGVDTVVNFAAQTHVDRSILAPEPFLRSNVLGVSVLLDCAVKAWREADGSFREGVRFLQISTDEVYGAGEQKAHENSPLRPGNPYAASKAAADLLCLAYRNTYGLPVMISRCSNNYGARQHAEKFIPQSICCAMEDRPIPLYGDGRQRRNWIEVGDHCRALLGILKKGAAGEIYNICSDVEIENILLAQAILRRMGKPDSLIEHVPDRPGHDACYRMEDAKLRALLGAYATTPFEEGLRRAIEAAQQ